MGNFKDNLVQRVINNVTGHLGEDATFVPCNGTSLSVRVVFDNSFELVDPDTETVISSNQPRVFVNLEDFPDGIEKGDKFILLDREQDVNRNYEVWTVQEDGQGGADCILHREDL